MSPRDNLAFLAPQAIVRQATPAVASSDVIAIAKQLTTLPDGADTK